MGIGTESVDMPRRLAVRGAVAATPPKATGREAGSVVARPCSRWWLTAQVCRGSYRTPSS